MSRTVRFMGNLRTSHRDDLRSSSRSLSADGNELISSRIPRRSSGKRDGNQLPKLFGDVEVTVALVVGSNLTSVRDGCVVALRF